MVRYIMYAGEKCYFDSEVNSSDIAQTILDDYKLLGVKACALHEKGKHQIYVENPIKYAIYDDSVGERRKYRVTELPTKFFDTKAKAKNWLEVKGFKPKNYKILKVDVRVIKELYG